MTLQTPPLARRHSGVVQLALGVVLVATATLATVTSLQTAQSTDTARSPETVAPVQAAPASLPVLDTPVRDQWYLDAGQAPASDAPQTYAPPVRDQWYLEQ